MKKLLLALALLFGASVARAQVDEIVDVIYEINAPPVLPPSHTILSTTHSDTNNIAPNNGDVLTFSSSGNTWGPAAPTGGGGSVATDTIWQANGDIVYGTGSHTAARLAGATGVLHSTGAAAPTWAAVATGDISNSAVTLAKIANAAANSKLVGSGAAGSGAAYSEITLGSGLSMSGTTLSSTGGGVADPGGNGLMARTSLNTSINRTLACAAAYCSWTNGDGVSGNPSLTLSITGTNDGGAVANQTSVVQSASYKVSGVGTYQMDNIGVNPTNAILLTNTTAAANGADQVSPNMIFSGQAWNSTGSASEQDAVRFSLRSTQNAGSTATTTIARWDTQVAGGAYTTGVVKFDMNGKFTAAQDIVSTSGSLIGNGNVQASSTGVFLWASRARVTSPSDGVTLVQNAAATANGTMQAIEFDLATTANGTLAKQVINTEAAITLATGGTTTASSTNLINGPCILKAIMGRITTTITTAANFTIKVTGGNVLNQIGTVTTSNTTLTSGTTYTWVPAAFADQYYTSAATVTITTNANPGAGAIRLAAVCETFTPPTS